MHRIDTATKATDLFGAGKDGFRNGNKAAGISATDFTAEFFNDLQENICRLLEAGGVVPVKDSYNQLTDLLIQKGMQGNIFSLANAAGTADAIAGNYTPSIAALTNGMTLYIRAGSANAMTTPTFTPAAGAIPAKTIVKGAGAALAVGDIAGAGHWIELQYDLALDKWVLLNPATGISAAQVKQIQPIAASVAANALTLTLNATSLDMRSSALTSGTINTRTVAAPISVVVPSTATLGTVNATAARLALLAIDNAGTVELAVVNLAGGNNLDETTLISTTAISAAATSASAIYSMTARSNVPFRVVGFIDITETIAGTWATAPSTIQGQGGQALAGISAIGYGQIWQDVTGSRVIGTTYYNTTGRPIQVSATTFSTTAASVGQMTVNGVVVAKSAQPGSGYNDIYSVIVPPGGAYSITQAGAGASLYQWSELR